MRNYGLLNASANDTETLGCMVALGQPEVRRTGKAAELRGKEKRCVDL